MSSDLEFYVHISPNGGYVGPDFLRQTVEEAESAGFDGIWAGDHVTLPGEIPAEYPFSETGEYWSDSGDDSYDVFQSLAFLAGATTDLTLGTNVAVAPYRHPVLLAKNALTAHALSAGGFELGVGVGWLSTEFEVLDVPFAERGSRTDEFLRCFERVLATGELAFDGPHHTFDKTGFHPIPDNPDALPVWIGGGSAATIRRVAEFADGWSAARQSPGDFGDVYDRLLTAWNDHDRDGRPRASIMDRCRLGPAHENESPTLAGPVADVVDRIDEYRRRGADRITVVVDDEFDHLRRFGDEVIDRF